MKGTPHIHTALTAVEKVTETRIIVKYEYNRNRMTVKICAGTLNRRWHIALLIIRSNQALECWRLGRDKTEIPFK